MTRRMFHMKREHNEMRSPAQLAGIEGAERGRTGRRTAVSAVKAGVYGLLRRTCVYVSRKACEMKKGVA